MLTGSYCLLSKGKIREEKLLGRLTVATSLRLHHFFVNALWYATSVSNQLRILPVAQEQEWGARPALKLEGIR